MKLLKKHVSKKELKNKLEIQMNNNKMMNDKNVLFSKENSVYQEKLVSTKLHITNLRVAIEDLKEFRNQDQECIKALKKERQSLKTKLTKLENKLISISDELGVMKNYGVKTILLKDESKVEFLKTSKRGKRDGK